MPTARVSHRVTETDDIAAAIDLGAQRWPDEPRINVVRRLILEGAAHLAGSATYREFEIENALRTLESLSSCYPDGYLRELRGDWEREVPS